MIGVKLTRSPPGRVSHVSTLSVFPYWDGRTGLPPISSHRTGCVVQIRNVKRESFCTFTQVCESGIFK